VTIADDKVKLNNAVLPAGGGVIISPFTITFQEGTRKQHYFLDMIRSNPAAMLYWVLPGTGLVVIWRREHLSGVAPDAEPGVAIDECGSKQYGFHAPLVHKQCKEICKRDFNHDKDGVTYTYPGVKPDHVESLLYNALKENRSWLYTVKTPKGNLEAFAIAHDVGQYEDGRRLYLDVVCARRQEKPKPGQRKVQYGKMIMDAVEEHARSLGFSVIELASLNAWLTDKYYRDRGYLEKESPTSGDAEERHPTYCLPDKKTPESLTDKEVRNICESRSIGFGKNLGLKALRDKLADQAWLGYRMTKWLELSSPESGAAPPAATPARSGLKRLRSSSEERQQIPSRTTRISGTLGFAGKEPKLVAPNAKKHKAGR